ncbi:MAG: endonuclease/exonuclease/phosphatase family protein [Culicoidibacterales bacterium]
MRIVSWNCQGKFREKYQYIEQYDADIYVIQECEDPKQSKNEGYRLFAENSLWTGINKTKGLGVFAKLGISLENKQWENYLLRHFLPVRINQSFDILAIWTASPHIEEYCVYQAIHKNKFHERMVVIGDFNSNKKWDSKHSNRTHTYAVETLKLFQLESAYHHQFQELQGEETQATLYMYRNKMKPYHIDYAFLNLAYYQKLTIGDYGKWAQYSDHMPLILETNLK